MSLPYEKELKTKLNARAKELLQNEGIERKEIAFRQIKSSFDNCTEYYVLHRYYMQSGRVLKEDLSTLISRPGQNTLYVELVDEATRQTIEGTEWSYDDPEIEYEIIYNPLPGSGKSLHFYFPDRLSFTFRRAAARQEPGFVVTNEGVAGKIINTIHDTPVKVEDIHVDGGHVYIGLAKGFDWTQEMVEIIKAAMKNVKPGIAFITFDQDEYH